MQISFGRAAATRAEARARHTSVGARLAGVGRAIAVLLLLAASNSAVALELFQGRIVAIEATYMPARVTFKMDQGNATCRAGALLVWQKDTENNKAVYAALLTAYASGRNVTFYIDDGDATCTGRFIYVVQ